MQSGEGMTESAWLLLAADAVLGVHVLFAGFIVFGIIIIWLGRAFSWRFVRNRVFRFLHAGCMGFVVLESLAGMLCPLTNLEYALRDAAGESGEYETTFMAYWADRLFYFTWSESFFIGLYAVFFILIVLTFFFVPVTSNRRNKKNEDI